MTPDDLKQWRESLGLNQRDAAEKHQVTLPTYQAWELGRSFQTGKQVKIKASVEAMCDKITRETKASLKSS